MNGRAGIFHEQKRLDEALAEWQRALAIDPNLPQIHHNCGAALFEAGRCDEAIASYDRALALKPDFAKALHNRVAALSRLMRYEEALATSDRLLALEPDNAGAHHNRGSALSSLMRFGEAVDAYSRALALKPDAVESLENRASVLAYLTRHDEAARDFAHVLVLDPDYTYVRGALQSSRQHCCDWRDYDDAVARLAADAEAGKRVSDPFPFVTTTWSAPAQLRCAQTWVAGQAAAGGNAAVARRALRARPHPRRLPLRGPPRACDGVPAGGRVRASRPRAVRDDRRVVRAG